RRPAVHPFRRGEGGGVGCLVLAAAPRGRAGTARRASAGPTRVAALHVGHDRGPEGRSAEPRELHRQCRRAGGGGSGTTGGSRAAAPAAASRLSLYGGPADTAG